MEERVATGMRSNQVKPEAKLPAYGCHQSGIEEWPDDVHLDWHAHRRSGNRVCRCIEDRHRSLSIWRDGLTHGYEHTLIGFQVAQVAEQAGRSVSGVDGLAALTV